MSTTRTLHTAYVRVQKVHLGNELRHVYNCYSGLLHILSIVLSPFHILVQSTTLCPFTCVSGHHHSLWFPSFLKSTHRPRKRKPSVLPHALGGLLPRASLEWYPDSEGRNLSAFRPLQREKRAVCSSFFEYRHGERSLTVSVTESRSFRSSPNHTIGMKHQTCPQSWDGVAVQTHPMYDSVFVPFETEKELLVLSSVLGELVTLEVRKRRPKFGVIDSLH